MAESSQHQVMVFFLDCFFGLLLRIAYAVVPLAQHPVQHTRLGSPVAIDPCIYRGPHADISRLPAIEITQITFSRVKQTIWACSAATAIAAVINCNSTCTKHQLIWCCAFRQTSSHPSIHPSIALSSHIDQSYISGYAKMHSHSDKRERLGDRS